MAYTGRQKETERQTQTEKVRPHAVRTQPDSVGRTDRRTDKKTYGGDLQVLRGKHIALGKGRISEAIGAGFISPNVCLLDVGARQPMIHSPVHSVGLAPLSVDSRSRCGGT